MFSTRLQWLWAQFRRQLIYRAAIIAALSVVAALLALVLEPYVPEDLAIRVGSDAVDGLLGIIASSMLAVTTFSLSTVVSAYASATSTATPRATALLLDDTVAQNMLATFIGAFIYAVAGIVLLKAGVYGTSGRLVLFAVTIGVIGLIVVMLVRWIDFLMHFGRLGNILDRIEKTAIKGLKTSVCRPNLGATVYEGDPCRKPPGTHEVKARDTGYVQFIDINSLNEQAGKHGEITLALLPGSFVHRGARLAYVNGEPEETLDQKVCEAFVVGSNRSFEQDPRLPLITMSEVASRALSPGVNDPGTAVEVLVRLVRIFLSMQEAGEPEKPRFDKVRVPLLLVDDLFDDAFNAIGRDGAGQIEVITRMLKSLDALRDSDPGRFGEAARRHAEVALARASDTLTSQADKQQLLRLKKELDV